MLDLMTALCYPFLKVADKLKEADLVFVNLENPIVENCPETIDGFKFCEKLSFSRPRKKIVFKPR